MGRFSGASALLAAGALFSAVSWCQTAATSELDPKTGALVFSTDALRTWDFESASGLVGHISLTKWESGWPPKLTLSAVKDASAVAEYLAPEGLEGKSAIRLAGLGVAIDDPALFSTLASGRFELTMWTRLEGTAPGLAIRYGRPEWSADSPFATVVGTRTGRETSDGWVEYTSGPIEGSVWGVPVRLLAITPSPGAPKGTSFLLDAIELRPVPGAPMLANACTMADVDTTCGALGDCLYGHCIPSSVTWGSLPPQAHRIELAERWIHLASRIIGDRRASEIGKTTFTATARDLAKYALSSRQFFGGMNRLVNLLRDSHTSFGSAPSSFGAVGATGFGAWSSGLHACFGVMEKNAIGGGLGYGVFAAGDAPTTGTVLKKGDVLTAIDGRDPKAWVDGVWPLVAHSMPNDPSSDLGQSASSLADMISMRAQNFTVVRCTSSTKCTGGDRKEIVVDVASKIFPRIIDKGGWGFADFKYFGCSPRFHDSVDKIDEPPPGEDAVTVRTLTGGISVVQFDGFSGGSGWETTFSTFFEAKPPKVIIDAREGHGGQAAAVHTLLSLMRGFEEPVGFISVIRGGWDDPDPATLLPSFETCTTDTGKGILGCFGAFGFFTDFTPAPGMASKIAWLNTSDISANDYMPRLLKGRSKLRIFAPHPTAGAFGAITSLPSMMSGWGGGSMQYQDSRFGADYPAVSASRWESSHGVEPDAVVAEKMTDALNDKDTMLEAAKAWVSE